MVVICGINLIKTNTKDFADFAKCVINYDVKFQLSASTFEQINILQKT